MDACFLFILVALFPLSQSQPTPNPDPDPTLQLTARFNYSDVHAAVMDMRSKSYYGFAVLLQMLNGTAQPMNRASTFLIPSDSKLSESPISVDHLEDFIISHSIAMPLSFNDFLHFPSGSLIPSGVDKKMLRINNRGRSNYNLNNAHIVTPNICLNSIIKCHGIDAVIQYDNTSYEGAK